MLDTSKTYSILLTLAGLIIMSDSYSQPENSNFFLRIKGIQGVELTGGLSDLGFSTSAGYVYYLANRWHTRVSLAYEVDRDNRFDNRTWSLDLIGASNLLILQRFFVNLLLGPTIVREDIRDFKTEEGFKHLVLGITTGIEGEYYLRNNVALVANGLLRNLLNSDLGESRYYANLGIKINF